MTGLGPTVPDDQFGGPQPDDAHFTGVIVRLNDDGTVPSDNPFFSAGAAMGGEVGANIQKIFAYAIRNSFGMAFDPVAGNLWAEENGEDAFDELNLIEPGMNGGWIQIMGPADRIAEYKGIEKPRPSTTRTSPTHSSSGGAPSGSPTRRRRRCGGCSCCPARTTATPSWKHVLAPAGMGFVSGRALGPQFLGDLFVGFAVPEPLGGPLFRFNLTGNRNKIAVDDPRLEDRVADNLTFHDLTESESLLIGRDFGIVTDIETGPNGNLFVVSLSDGAIYEIFRR